LKLPSINGLKREDCEALLEELEGEGTIAPGKKRKSTERRPDIRSPPDHEMKIMKIVYSPDVKVVQKQDVEISQDALFSVA
jgi:hypothetical protein